MQHPNLQQQNEQLSSVVVEVGVSNETGPIGAEEQYQRDTESSPWTQGPGLRLGLVATESAQQHIYTNPYSRYLTTAAAAETELVENLSAYPVAERSIGGPIASNKTLMDNGRCTTAIDCVVSKTRRHV